MNDSTSDTIKVDTARLPLLLREPKPPTGPQPKRRAGVCGHGLTAAPSRTACRAGGQSPRNRPARCTVDWFATMTKEQRQPTAPTSCHRARRDRTMPLDQIGERQNAIGIVILGRNVNVQCPNPGTFANHSPVAVRKFACPSLQLFQVEGCGCARVFDAGGLAASACRMKLAAAKASRFNGRGQRGHRAGLPIWR